MKTCIFMTALVSNCTMVVSLRLPATIFVMVSNIIVDFIIIVVTLVTRLTIVHWFVWLREAAEVFRPVDIYCFDYVYKVRPMWFEL
jgi:hypothetical protein